jgi:hypothetical protein
MLVDNHVLAFSHQLNQMCPPKQDVNIKHNWGGGGEEQ